MVQSTDQEMNRLHRVAVGVAVQLAGWLKHCNLSLSLSQIKTCTSEQA